MLRWMLAVSILTATALRAQSVDGHVVNAANGTAIAGATVFIHPRADSPQEPVRTTSDAEGRFHVDSLLPGAYALFCKAHGFWSDAQKETEFEVDGTRKAIQIDLKLKPLPKVSGRVLDSRGKPVAHATVLVLSARSKCNGLPCYPLVKESQTDAGGEYRIEDADAFSTSWLISAKPPTSWDPPDSPKKRPLGWAQTFYPGTTDPQLAATVAAEPGTEHWNLDIKLAAVPVHRIRGRIVEPAGKPAPGIPVVLYNGLGLKIDQTTASDGTFEFAAVADGDWRLSARLDRDKTKFWATEVVQLKDEDLGNVELRVIPPFSLHGKMLWERPDGVSAPAEPPNVIFVYDTGFFDAGGAISDNGVPVLQIGHPDENGDFTIQAYPGPYHLYVLGTESGGSPYYLDSVRLGDRDALAAETIPILSDTQPVAVQFKYGGGSVQGAADGCGGCNVLLIPVDPLLRRPGLVQMSKCDAKGQFQFRAIRPGDYYGVAIPGDRPGGPGLSAEIDSLLSRANKITVHNNEHTSADIRILK